LVTVARRLPAPLRPDQTSRVMELELIEPVLYLQLSPALGERLAQAFAEVCVPR
jgi:hypothetical protein